MTRLLPFPEPPGARSTSPSAFREVMPVAPALLGAFGAAIDEKALVDGVAGAIDANAVVGAAKAAAEDAGPTR